MTNLDRRSFLSRGALLAGATVMGPAAFTAITAGAAGASEGIGRGRGRRIAGDYGPLAPVPQSTSLAAPTSPCLTGSPMSCSARSGPR